MLKTVRPTIPAAGQVNAQVDRRARMERVELICRENVSVAVMMLVMAVAVIMATVNAIHIWVIVVMSLLVISHKAVPRSSSIAPTPPTRASTSATSRISVASSCPFGFSLSLIRGGKKGENNNKTKLLL